MSRTSRILLLVLPLLVLPMVPVDGLGQVSLRRRPVERADGETLEMDRAEIYLNTKRYRRAIREERQSDKRDEVRERQLAYAADACGLGCEGHEGLQVRGIPGTHLAAVVYKAYLDEDVLTVQLRFHNDGLEPARLTIDPLEMPGSVFVQIGETRILVLTGDDGEQQSKGVVDEVLEPGEIESWWARFPAPPRGATTFDLHIPAVTFHDVQLEID